MTKRKLTDEEIAKKCLTCKFGYWSMGVHYCKRKTCKYKSSR